MNYENKPCPACGAHLHESDDIVVCPVCATPQHRSCWMERGCCVNEARHAEGYLWTADEANASAFEPEQNQVNENETIICPVCGSENPAGSKHCGACGAFIAGQQNRQQEFIHCNNCGLENDPHLAVCARCGAPLGRAPFMGYTGRNYDSFFAATGIDENEKIGDYTAGEFAIYLRTNIKKYLEKFRRIENDGKKASFNWAAFCFGPLWFFYRKMYKAGTLLLVVLAAVSLIAASCYTQINEVMAPYYEAYTAGTVTEEQAIDTMTQVGQIAAVPYSITFGLMLAIDIVFAVLANYLYYKKITDDFRIINEQVPDKNMQAMLVSRRGGVSVLNVFCAYFAFEVFVNLFAWIAEKLSAFMA